jgi:dTDP-glucose pyrophosphorylase
MKNITIKPNATIKEAMELLDKTAEKVLLVIDGENKLIGSLTDGDIRRYILQEQNLVGSIECAYRRNPIFVFQQEIDTEKIKSIFIENVINLIPILDHDRKVVDYLTWEKVFGNDWKSEKQKISAPVVIMAGGRGTRLEPFTKVLPKPLIPVGDKTVIDHIIDRFRAYGISEFYLTINYMAKIMRAYFDEKCPDYTIEFAEENEPKGTAGSLKLIKNKLRTPFFVSNCDIIIETDYADLYNFHKKGNYDITLVAATKQFNIPYGVCELNGEGTLKTINEKPEYNFLVNAGLYVLNPEVLEFIPDRGIFHITHLMEKVLKNTGSVGVYPVSESSWVDVGQWAEYRNALKVIENI